MPPHPDSPESASAPQAALAAPDRALPAAPEIPREPATPAARRRGVNLLEGGIRPTVFWLALPVFGEQLLNAAVAWNDMFMAGLIDTPATVSVGTASYVDWLVGMLFMLVGTGATAIVARAIGARRRAEADHILGQAVMVALLMGLLGAAAATSAADGLMQWFGLEGDTALRAARFTRIGACGYVIEAVTFAGAACLRGAGDTRTPMVVLGLVNIVNVAASWALAFGMELGAEGIAFGTLIARGVGGVMMLEVLIRGRSQLKLTASQMRPDMTAIGRILKVGGPAAADGMLMCGGHFIFLHNVSHAGGGFTAETLTAAHVVGVRIESLSYLPATAWGIAAATLVGQNLGAQQPDRSRRCAREASRQAMALLSTMGLTYLLAAPWLMRILTHDAEVIRCGVPALRVLGLVQPALAVLIVYLWALRGAGDTTFPILFTVAGVFMLRIPLSYVGGPVMQWALVGAWLGMYTDLTLRSVMMALRFRSGRWAKARV